MTPGRLTGIFPPLPTPFRDGGSLDLDALRLTVERLNESALSGYLALGSNGEAIHMSPEECSLVLQAVSKASAPGRIVLAGTGQASTWATVEMSRRAADAGCDAALVLTPFYYRGSMTAPALERHFTAVADASPIPIVLYNVPAATAFNLPPAVAERMSHHENVIGIKDSAGDVAQLSELVRLTRDARRFDVLSGSFGATLPGLAVGVSGAVVAVANVLPDACVRLMRLFSEGRLEEARELHLGILPLARAVTSLYGVPGLKAALELLGAPAGIPRPPLLPLDREGRAEIESILAERSLLWRAPSP